MKKLEERFNEAIDGVKEYTRKHSHESNIKTNYPEYKNLVNMGVIALPYLRKRLGKENEIRWEIVLAIRDIIQDSGRSLLFPNEIAGNLEGLENYLKGYLDCYSR
jgi:hypothetical protein